MRGNAEASSHTRSGNPLHPKRFSMAAALMIAAVIKSIASILTPLNGDFINWAHMASFRDLELRYLGPYTFPVYILNIPYRLWLLLPVEHLNPEEMLNHGVFRPSISAYTYVFAMKLPMIIFDLLTAILIYKTLIHLTGSEKNSLTGYYIWLFNPYLLIAVEMSGEVDVIPACLVMLSFLLLCRRRVVLSGLALASATLTRIYPLIFIPLMLMKTRRESRKSLLGFSTAFAAVILCALIPFIQRFKAGVIQILWGLPLYGMGEISWWILEPKLSANLPETDISLLVLIYLLVLAIWLKLPRISGPSLMDSMQMTLLPYLAFSYWNEEFLLWIAPLITVDYILNREKIGKVAYSITFATCFVSMYAYVSVRWWFPRQLFLDPTIPALSQLSRMVANLSDTIGYVEEGLNMISRSILAGVSAIIMAGILERNVKPILDRSIPILSTRKIYSSTPSRGF
ncbi:MAG: glycosyltransferase family 87 protein [Candidatus Bathyarchaeia archaeon]